MAVSATALEQRIALQRFGLGLKPGAPTRIGANAKAMVLAEIATPQNALITAVDLPDYGTACAVGEGDSFEAAENICEAELRARFAKAMTPEIGFTERLVHFWSNHFSMSTNKAMIVRATCGQLERDVIRRHVYGRFTDMLKGVLSHPAMIAYLDNGDSIGPHSSAGDWGGLNENLAREILELHTVGTGAGYTENDVNQLARVITGWSWVRGWEADYNYNGGTLANRGRFIYRPDWHEPGTLTVMGRTYAATTNRNQGLAVLAALAVHGKTAEHIAFKLIRHFLTDTPTTTQVAALKKVFLDTKGDLAAVSRALVELPDSWTLPLTKLRTPYEMAIAQFRAMGAPPVPVDTNWEFRAPLYALNNMTWEHGPPDGWADETPVWLNPDAARIRLDAAIFFRDVYFKSVTGSPVTRATQLFGEWLSTSSKAAVAKGADTRQKTGLLLTLPELQRR
jgi:uncharacterized protein (DUF1800 family)